MIQLLSKHSLDMIITYIFNFYNTKICFYNFLAILYNIVNGSILIKSNILEIIVL
jgi:hypothetical protein